jgi:alpha-beta hydrolase superfamily lysophospholipase
MQKVNFQNSEGLNLFGALHTPEETTNSAVIISHAFTASKDRKRLVETAEALANNGITAFRIDFGGCGESDEREITIKNQVDDLKSAISYLKNKGYDRIGLLGESLGGITSILAYDESISTMVLWAPVTKSKIPTLIQKEEIKEELNEEGYIIFHKEGREFKIPKEYLEERLNVNTKEILQKIKCPVLIIHGDADPTLPISDSKEAMQFLSQESQLEIVKSKEHIMDNVLGVVIPKTVSWFNRYLK